MKIQIGKYYCARECEHKCSRTQIMIDERGADFIKEEHQPAPGYEL